MERDVAILYDRLKDVRRGMDELSSEEIEKSRRNLLISSMVTLIISITGAVPTKIEALGVEFTAIEQRYFFVIAGFIVLYFFIKFCVRYAEKTVKKTTLRNEEYDLIEEINIKNISPDSKKTYIPLYILFPYSAIGIFDTVIPIIVGLISIFTAAYAAIEGHSIVYKDLLIPTLSHS